MPHTLGITALDNNRLWNWTWDTWDCVTTPFSFSDWWWQWRRRLHTFVACKRRSRRRHPVTWWTHVKRLKPSSLPWPEHCRNTSAPPDNSTSTAWRAYSSTWPSASQTTWHPRWGHWQGDSQSGGFYHKIIPDRVIMNNLEGVHFTIKTGSIWRLEGSQACLNPMIMSYTVGWDAFNWSFFEGSINVSFAAFDIPQSCTFHSMTVELKNKDGAWELSPNLYCFVVNH